MKGERSCAELGTDCGSLWQKEARGLRTAE